MKISSVLIIFIILVSNGISQSQVKSYRTIDQNKFNPFYGLKKIWNPEIFQGNNKNKTYFEGWYFKLVDRNKSAIYSIIPGIALGKNDSMDHAFIQVINGTTGETFNINYPRESFRYSKKGLAVIVGDSFFSDTLIILNIQSKNISITGNIHFAKIINYPVKLFKPGIMGWYRFVPFMECYHGIVSMNHQLDGNLKVNNTDVSFVDGKGYIEKDWGSSMPSSWIWMQSNHFNSDSMSLSFSLANIPWLGNEFPGFIVTLLYNGIFYDFTTYNGSEIIELDVDDKFVRIKLKGKKNTLDIIAERAHTGDLLAPVMGKMEREIAESIGAFIHITLTDNKDGVIISDTGMPAGLEIVGDLNELDPVNN